MSHSILSRHSIHCRFDIGASSQIIIFAICRSLAKFNCLLILQTVESSILSGILNLECIVHPLGKIDATTPDDVVASTIRFLDLGVARIARYKNVFPLPPRPSMKNAPGSWLVTFCSIISYACFCSKLRHVMAIISFSSTTISNSSLISFDIVSSLFGWLV